MATQKDQKLVLKTEYCLMQVKSIADAPKEHSAILLTFIKLSFVIKIFVVSIFEWLLKTGFTVYSLYNAMHCGVMSITCLLSESCFKETVLLKKYRKMTCHFPTS